MQVVIIYYQMFPVTHFYIPNQTQYLFVC